MANSHIPDFDSLPKVKDMPQGCAWGVFDKDGKKDHIGCLNLLAPDVVQEAFKEARDGVSVSLNWPLGAISKPGFNRKGLEHKVLSFKESPFDIHGFDDEVEFNTQCSSQWDSLLHFAHQPTGLNYNCCKPSKDDLIQSFGKADVNNALPSLDHWHNRGGLVGRGVLLDYRAYALAKGIQYSCFDDHAISVKTLEDVAKYQGTEFKFGDILIVRTGFTEDLQPVTADEQERMLGTNKACGVKGCRETAKWVWNHHFAAVASDALGFEVLPPKIEDEGDRVGSFGELGMSKVTCLLLYEGFRCD